MPTIVYSRTAAALLRTVKMPDSDKGAAKAEITGGADVDSAMSNSPPPGSWKDLIAFTFPPTYSVSEEPSMANSADLLSQLCKFKVSTVL